MLVTVSGGLYKIVRGCVLLTARLPFLLTDDLEHAMLPPLAVLRYTVLASICLITGGPPELTSVYLVSVRVTMPNVEEIPALRRAIDPVL